MLIYLCGHKYGSRCNTKVFVNIILRDYGPLYLYVTRFSLLFHVSMWMYEYMFC